MANARSSSDIVQTIGGDSRSRIANWLYRRIYYHRTRFEFLHEYNASKLYTLEQDESDGTWHTVQDSNYPDYDYEKEAWYDFLEWMSKYPTPYERTYNRTQILKEELIAAVYHPSRVEKWLELGDDVLEMMF